MKIKTSCVRCGKTIEGTGPYCSTCATAKNSVAEEISPPKRPRALLGCAVLLLLLGVATLFFSFRGEEAPPPPTSNEQTISKTQGPEPASVQHSEAQPDQQPAETTTAAPAIPSQAEPQKDAREASSADTEGIELEASASSPALEADGQQAAAAGQNATSAAPSAAMPESETAQSKDDEPPSADNAPSTLQHAASETRNSQQEEASTPSLESTLDVADEASSATAQSSTNPSEPSESSGATDSPAPLAAGEESDATIPSLVWIYYANDPGKDERYKAVLEDEGYTNVAAKGEWATKYPVNYIFYRPKNKEGLQELASAMDELDFKVFHHLDSATSPRLRGYFADNPQLEFLLILQ